MFKQYQDITSILEGLHEQIELKNIKNASNLDTLLFSNNI